MQDKMANIGAMILPGCHPQTCKEFRRNLKKPSPVYNKKPKKRVVPAFTIQALQDNTMVQPPPKSDYMRPKPLKGTKFKQSYLRGEIPVCIEFVAGGKRVVSWKFPCERLDYSYYLPMFCEGLADDQYPINFIVEKGIMDMVVKCPTKVLACVPQLVCPIRDSLLTKIPDVVCKTLRCIQTLVKNCQNVGEALVPYYRQLLPVLNMFLSQRDSGDVDEIIVREDNMFYTIDDTLQVLEEFGGPDAFVNIKYCIPTYESAVN